MRHALLLNSCWQIQQVRLSTWVKFSSVKEEDNIPDFLPVWVNDDSGWGLFNWKRWSCCFHLKWLSLACLPLCFFQFDEMLKHFLRCLHFFLMVFLLCEFVHVSCNVLIGWNVFYNACICMASRCEFVHVPCNVLMCKSIYHKTCMYTTSLLCDFVHVACNLMRR